MPKILIITDKFKGSLSSKEAGSAIASGFRKIRPDVDIEEFPLADGGDGTIEVLEHLSDEKIYLPTLDPLGRRIEVPVLRSGKRILCELAKSTGLQLLQKHERDPLKTSSFGLGVILNEIALMGYKNILLGIGGSATNDAGAGMLEAFGYLFLDSEGAPAKRGEFMTGAHLVNISGIDDSSVPPYIRNLKIDVACDVNNPLTGAYGATMVYGPQKGANADALELLEEGVLNFSRVTARYFGLDNSEYPGAGAAGGVGFALKTFLGASLQSGWRLIFDYLDIESKIEESDIIITGEGRVDGQSLSGKLFDGVLTMSLKHKKRVWVICGENLLTDRELERIGVEHLFSVSQFEPSKDKAIANAKENVEKISQLAATFLR